MSVKFYTVLIEEQHLTGRVKRGQMERGNEKMSKLFQKALEDQRAFYCKKLLSLGIYNQEVLSSMTLSELKKEYHYFFNNIPLIKLSHKKSV
jgi:predicted GNAT family N-acyltransferase